MSIRVRGIKTVAVEAATSLKRQAIAKQKKITCSHPKNKRRLIHVPESSTTIEQCTLCNKKFGRVVLPPKKTRPDYDEQQLVAEAKKKNFTKPR